MSGDSILLAMIHDKAVKSYQGEEINAANYEIWVAHWFDCAEKLVSEFMNEHLYATAQAVRNIIEEQREFYK